MKAESFIVFRASKLISSPNSSRFPAIRRSIITQGFPTKSEEVINSNLSVIRYGLWLRRLHSGWELINRTSALLSIMIYRNRSKNIIRRLDEQDVMDLLPTPCFYTAQAMPAKYAHFLKRPRTAPTPNGSCRQCSSLPPPGHAAVISSCRILESGLFRRQLRRNPKTLTQNRKTSAVNPKALTDKDVLSHAAMCVPHRRRR